MLNEILEKIGKNHSEKNAIIYDKLKITYRDLILDIKKFSTGLHSLGIRPKECIAVLLPNCPQFIVSFFAIARINAILLPLNHAFNPNELKNNIKTAKAKVIITDINYAKMCQQIIETVDKTIKLIVCDGELPQAIKFDDMIKNADISTHINRRTTYDGDFVYLFSSGSTGRPKMLCRSQANYCFEMQGFVEQTNTTHQDRILCAIPLFHSHGIGSCILPTFGTGATLVILDTLVPGKKGTHIESKFYKNIQKMFELIQREKITIFPAVPYIFSAMVENPFPEQAALTSTRLCFSSGNFLSQKLFHSFHEKYNLMIRQIYGCSEAGAVSINMATDSEFDIKSVGKAFNGIQLKVVDDDSIEVAPNTVGEIVFNSPGQTRGYHGLPELNQQAFKAGFFYTGDLGRIDANGNLTVTGRKKILIDTGGRKVDPIEVEDVLKTHKQVKDAVVVGIAGRSGNEVVKAVIVPEGDCTKEELWNYCQKQLADFKIPKIIEYREEIPRNPVGKILRKELIKSTESNGDIEKLLKDILSRIIKDSETNIDSSVSLEEYGIDSATIMEMNAMLSIYFDNLPKTLFFEYDNLRDLAVYLHKNHKNDLSRILGANSTSGDFDGKIKNAVSDLKTITNATVEKNDILIKTQYNNEIAIIGLSGRYPQAPDIRKFWDILRTGQDCITEIPPDRWNKDDWYTPDKTQKGKSYCKWGGFLKDVDKFDPEFFSIAPKEAELMDPQERLFLQEVWSALEDAGYLRSRFIQETGGDNRVGVFVGVMWGNYQLFGVENLISCQDTRPVKSHFWEIANRISYFFNFQGPSLAIDTACSSSLTAIHLACQSILQGECTMAVSGGVNLSLHPLKYVLIADGQYASTDGRCRSFGKNGDGYVPGEGVGAIVLKPVQQAVADGDHIYGLIKGSAVNHGGKTKGFTVPNPNVQGQLIERVFKNADIDPRTISYIEAHGTGTVLGDPIEIAGLSKAFGSYTQDKQFCAIGSAKSNIGHCESAAGIAGLTKVLLQLQHRQLVPSLHSKQLNPNIDFSQTPFVVQQRLCEWKRPRVQTNGSVTEYPRIAGISAFGAGGSNAHVVIEEYQGTQQAPDVIHINSRRPAIVVLSAKSPERLQAQVQRLLAAIKAKGYCDGDLADMAYTLQVGREAMEERLAVMVTTLGELQEKLQGFLKGGTDIENLYRGKRQRHKEMVDIFLDDEELRGIVDKWILHQKYDKILNLWVQGMAFDWNRLYGKIRPHRISMPTYPFAQERYWVPERAGNSIFSGNGSPAVLHPLLHQNTSDLSEQRYSSHFTGTELFWADHRLKGQRVLPAMACLEMARAAVSRAARYQVSQLNGIRISNVVWAQPVVAEDRPKTIHISVFPEDNSRIGYEIYSQTKSADTKFLLHCQGEAELNGVADPGHLNLTALQYQNSQNSLNMSDCYEILDKLGVTYRTGCQGIEKLLMGSDQILAKLCSPLGASDQQSQYVLHPGLLDSAILVSAGLMLDSANPVATSQWQIFPIALQALEVSNSRLNPKWVLVKYSDGDQNNDTLCKLNIDICDDRGMIGIRMKNLAFKKNIRSDTSIQRFVSKSIVSAGAYTADEPGKPTDIQLRSLSVDPIQNAQHKSSDQPPVNLPQHDSQLSIVSSDEYNSEQPVKTVKSLDSLQEELARSLADAMYIDRSAIDFDKQFVDMGLDSIVGVEWIRMINKQYGVRIKATTVYDYSCVREFAGYMAKELKNMTPH